MNNTVIVWGKLHGSNVDCKLVRFEGKNAVKLARGWMDRNRKYYNDMRICYFHEKQSEEGQSEEEATRHPTT